ncbi:MAG: hypothetical protein ACRDH5_04440 [bacterium]
MPRAAEVDWTGIAPPTEPIAPLTAETFVARLNSLSASSTRSSGCSEPSPRRTPDMPVDFLLERLAETGLEFVIVGGVAPRREITNAR